MNELADIAPEIQHGAFSGQEWDKALVIGPNSIGRRWRLWHIASVHDGKRFALVP